MGDAEGAVGGQAPDVGAADQDGGQDAAAVAGDDESVATQGQGLLGVVGVEDALHQQRQARLAALSSQNL